MSIRVMSDVWKVSLPASDKLVLLALADCANDEGGCWPSMKTLARKCSKTDRTVQASIKRLVDGGHLSRNEAVGKGCFYTVHPVMTPEESSPRRIFPPKNLTQTPEESSDKPSRTTTFEKAKAFSVRDAFSAWNETAKKTGLPVAKDLTPQRSKHIAARLRVAGEAGWREALAAVEASPLCVGDNERGWRADLDFVCQPKPFSKLREGSYAPKDSTTGPPVTVDPARVAAMTADFKARQRAYLAEMDDLDASH